MNQHEAGRHKSGVLLLLGLCAGAIVIGWSLLLASLLYVVADYSTGTWLLTALAMALAHVVFASLCWRYAVANGGIDAVCDRSDAAVRRGGGSAERRREQFPDDDRRAV